MNFNGLYNIRPAVTTDKNFILASFLRGLYYGNSWFNMIPKAIFMKHYGEIAEQLIHSPRVKVNIACLPDDPDTILGYSITSLDDSTVHWVFVKSRWRLYGIGKSLTPKAATQASHLSDLGKKLIEKNNLIYNPFAI